MFAPAMTFWTDEALPSFGKISRAARDEFGIFMHEINTDRQSDIMLADSLFGGDLDRYKDPHHAAWLDSMAESWDDFLETQNEELYVLGREEALKEIDHRNFGYGVHESDCSLCSFDEVDRQVQLDIDHMYGEIHGQSAGCIFCLDMSYVESSMFAERLVGPIYDTPSYECGCNECPEPGLY